MDFEEFEKYKDVEFKAYSRALLRCLRSVKISLESGNQEEALRLIKELIEDTESAVEE